MVNLCRLQVSSQLTRKQKIALAYNCNPLYLTYKRQRFPSTEKRNQSLAFSPTADKKEEKGTEMKKRPSFQQGMHRQEQEAVYRTVYSVIVYTKKESFGNSSSLMILKQF